MFGNLINLIYFSSLSQPQRKQYLYFSIKSDLIFIFRIFYIEKKTKALFLGMYLFFESTNISN